MALPTRANLLSLDFTGTSGPYCRIEAKSGLNTLSLDVAGGNGVFIGAATTASTTISGLGGISAASLATVGGVSAASIAKILGVEF